jgi:hypothetical protein
MVAVSRAAGRPEAVGVVVKGVAVAAPVLRQLALEGAALAVVAELVRVLAVLVRRCVVAAVVPAAAVAHRVAAAASASVAVQG